MNQLQRLDLLGEIGEELQSRMSFSDIDIYFTGFGINSNLEDFSGNNKSTYAKEILSGVDDEIIIEIANQLEINYLAISPNSSSGNWKPNHFKLFMSHLSIHKGVAGRLQKSLLGYGINSFVAHEDIAPTKEWQSEIESSLLTMNALAAVLTPGFNDSKWTDHEVGAAIGRNLYIIPLDKGLKPYGFIEKYQAVPTKNKNVGQVAKEIFNLLITKKKLKLRW